MSSAPDRVRLPYAERSHLIEEAATRLFAERGYPSTSVEDIVTAAGVTKPMLYRHFESKQELCISLLRRYREELIAAPLRELGTVESLATARSPKRVRDQLALGIEAWLSWVESHRDATRLLLTPIRGEKDVQEVQEELFRRQRASQSALLREFAPGLSEADAEPLAEITRAAFSAAALWWLEHPDQPKAVVHQALLTMAQGIVATTNSPSAE
jgi:AcrR family transcriptional regulator